MMQAIANSVSLATPGSAAAGTFGAVPVDYSLLLWLPPVVLLFGLAAWLVALVVLQRRQPRRPHASRVEATALWAACRFDPRTQP
jgi:hypothetical protein